MRIYVGVMTAYDPVGASVETIYFADAPFTSAPTDTPANTRFLPRLQRAPVVSLNMYAPGGRSGGATESSPGEAVLMNPDGALDYLFGYYVDGRTWLGYVGEDTGAFPADFELVDSATVVGLSDGYETITVRLRDRRRSLDVPLQPNKYAGDWSTVSSTLEGDTEMAGKPKPWAFGKVTNATPALVNPGKHIYQFHDGALDSVDGIYDSGIALHLNPVGLVGISSTPFTSIPAALAYGDGYWVAGGTVSGTPTLANSDDGDTFTTRDNTTLSVQPNGIVFGDGVFISFGNGAELARSDDNGVTWTTPTSGFTADAIRSGRYGPGYFVIVGDAGKTAKSNADGSSWTMNASGSAQSLNSVAYGNGIWLACSTLGDMYSSTDGASWSSVTSTAPGSGRLSFGGGLFVLGLVTTGAIYTSPDGVVWTQRFSPATATVYAPTYVDGFGWVAISDVHMLASRGAEAVTWVRNRVTSGPTFGTASRIATDGSKILITANDGAEYIVRTTGIALYASQADLLDDSLAPMAGLAKAYLAGGLVRLGSEPIGPLTGDVTQGDTAADRTVGQFLEAAATAAGLTASPAQYDATDITALDTLQSAVIGVYVDGETTVRGLMDEVCAGLGVWYASDTLGVLHFGRLDAPEDQSPVALVITEAMMRQPLQRLQSTDVADGVPYYRTTVRHSRNYSPTALDISGINRPAWREATDIDSSVQTAHPLARQSTIDSHLTSAAAALTDAQRVQNLRGTARHPYRTAVTDTAANRAALAIGATVSAVTTRYGFSAGKALAVMGLRYDRETEIIELTLWG